MARRVAAALVAVTVVAVVGFALVLLLRPDPQSEVEIEAGTAPTPVAELNRSDDAGADVVRAYLAGALACDEDGREVMRRLSRPGETDMARVVARACASSGDRPWAETVKAELARDELDLRGNSFWRVEADGSPLPADLVLRVGQEQGNWQIERRCRSICEEN